MLLQVGLIVWWVASLFFDNLDGPRNDAGAQAEAGGRGRY